MSLETLDQDDSKKNAVFKSVLYRRMYGNYHCKVLGLEL